MSKRSLKNKRISNARLKAVIGIVLYILFVSYPSTIVLAAPIFQGDRKAAGDDFDSFKSEKTVAVQEKTRRIKREKVTAIKPIPLKTYMQAISLDRRLDKFLDILKKVNEDDADSCPSCWSVFNKFITSAITVLTEIAKADKFKELKKANSKEDPLKKNEEADETRIKPRYPNTTVVENSRIVFVDIAASKESRLIFDALQILNETLNRKEEKTQAEHDYFSTLAHYMMKPFYELYGEEQVIAPD